MKECPFCNKEIKKGEWVVEGKRFGLFSWMRTIHIHCLGKRTKKVK